MLAMKRFRTALTLAELVLSMAIMAIVGAGVAGVSMALSTAHIDSQAVQENIQTASASMMRLQKCVSGAKLVTSISPDAVVIWTEGVDGDNKIDLSELVTLCYDPDTKELSEQRVIFPVEMAVADKAVLDASVTLASAGNKATVNTLTSASQYYQTRLIASNVESFQAIASPAAPMSKLLTLKYTVGAGDNAIDVRTACCLRADARRYVATSGGDYVLITE